MKIRTTITTEIDVKKVFELCSPVYRKLCLKAMRDIVVFLIEMRATDESGFWNYPSEQYIAAELIDRGLATHSATQESQHD